MAAAAIRPGTAADCGSIAAMVRDLACLAGVEAGVTGPILAAQAFGPRPTIALLVAECDVWTSSAA